MNESTLLVESNNKTHRPKSQTDNKSKETPKRPRKNSPSAPNPMELLRIARDFGLLVPETFYEVTDEESGDIRRGLSSAYDNICRQALEDAAHLYHLAKAVADGSSQDPWISRNFENEERIQRRAVLNLWLDIEALGEIVSDEEALKLSETYKSIGGLRKGLTKFGSSREARKFRNSTVTVLDILVKKWNKYRDRIRKRNNRSGKTPTEESENIPSESWLETSLERELRRLRKANAGYKK